MCFILFDHETLQIYYLGFILSNMTFIGYVVLDNSKKIWMYGVRDFCP